MNYFESIKFLVMDVDGTLTDGKIYMGDTGEMLKVFDIKDGYGIKEILPKYNIIPVIITARTSQMLEHRCKELDIHEFHQGVRNKIGKLEQIIVDYSKKDNCKYTFANIAYIGDDTLDIQCMKPVKETGGLAVCPSNAAKSVLEIADFISTRKCGEGAVREFIEWLVNLKMNSGSSLERIKMISQSAYDFIIGFCPSKNPDGRYEIVDGIFANVMTYITKNIEMTCYETHMKYIDIQYIIYGTEIMMINPLQELKNYVSMDYNLEKDITLYNYSLGDVKILSPGDFVVLYPNDAHRGAISLDKPTAVRKIVIKIPIKNL